jgi:hypothetical protein
MQFMSIVSRSFAISILAQACALALSCTAVVAADAATTQ